MPATAGESAELCAGSWRGPALEVTGNQEVTQQMEYLYHFCFQIHKSFFKCDKNTKHTHTANC